MIKGQLTNLGSHSCLGELRDGIFGILDSVANRYVSLMFVVYSNGSSSLFGKLERPNYSNSPCLVRIKNTSEQNTIKFQSNVIRSDSALARNLNGNFLETLDVCDSIDKRHKNSQTRFENAVELSHTLHNPSCLLRHEANYRIGGKSGLREVRGHSRGSEAGGDESSVRGAEGSAMGGD